MRPINGLMAAALLLSAGMALSASAPADFEVTGPDGRRILLEGNGTWKYVETADKKPPAAKPKPEGELLLVLERKTETDTGCRFQVQLSNNAPYEVGNLLLYYAAYRVNGHVYDTVSPGSGFNTIKPGDKQRRQFEVAGLACRDIGRVQVVGGDRCVMGDLHRWLDQSEHKGECLARVRVAESQLVRFDK